MYEYLKKLSKLEDFDIQLEKDGVRFKWVKFSTLHSSKFNGDYIVHRKCLNREIILDLDDDNIILNQWALYWLMRTFDDANMVYQIYYSGGKGFHMSILFDWNISYLEGEKLYVSKMSLSKRISIIRRTILIDVFETQSQEVKEYFLNLIDFQMVDVHRKLIRAEGSKHHKGNSKCLIPLKTEQLFELDIEGLKKRSRENCILPNDYVLNKIDLKNVYTDEVEYTKAQEKADRLKPKQDYSKFSNTMRPKIKELLSKAIEDGKKQVLYILIRELKARKFTIEQSCEIINTWNQLSHTEKLKDTDIIPQVQYAYARVTYPLRNETIDKLLQSVTFK